MQRIFCVCSRNIPLPMAEALRLSVSMFGGKPVDLIDIYDDQIAGIPGDALFVVCANEKIADEVRTELSHLAKRIEVLDYVPTEGRAALEDDHFQNAMARVGDNLIMADA